MNMSVLNMSRIEGCRSADVSTFCQKLAIFVIPGNANKNCIPMHFFLILLTPVDFLKVALINIILILMMSVKLATPGLLTISYFEIKFMTSYFCPWRHQQNFIF